MEFKNEPLVVRSRGRRRGRHAFELFEDRAATENFSPIALLRPAFELLCGQFCPRVQALRFLPVTDWGASLAAANWSTFIRKRTPEAHVNDLDWLQAPRRCSQRRWLADPKSFAKCDPETAGIIDGWRGLSHVDPEDVNRLTENEVDRVLMEIARSRHRVTAPENSRGIPGTDSPQSGSIERRFLVETVWPIERQPIGAAGGHRGQSRRVHVDPSASVDPFVVIDARKGPVTIEADAMIQAFTRLEGPCHIGRGSQLFRSQYSRGNEYRSRLPCRRRNRRSDSSRLRQQVSRWISRPQLVCPWVNLGALPRRQRSQKRLLGGESATRRTTPGISGELKVGCFIGDHTKTAIGSLFNTGTSVGVMCLILPDGELLPKHVPSFSGSGTEI